MNLNVSLRKIGLIIVSGVAGAALAIGLWPSDWPVWKPETYGLIFVDTPEVYTRERLVNDRFEQEFWLSQQLKATLAPDQNFEVEARFSQERTASLAAAINVGGSADGEAADIPPQPRGSEESALPALGFSKAAEFQDLNTFRNVIRNEKMRTELDDGHDIEGNTLYRLAFDITLAPGPNTKAAALILVRLDEDAAKWRFFYREIYSSWHKHLQNLMDGAVKNRAQELQRGEHSDSVEAAAFNEYVLRYVCLALLEPEPECNQGISGLRTVPDVQRLINDYTNQYENDVLQSIKVEWMKEISTFEKNQRQENPIVQLYLERVGEWPKRWRSYFDSLCKGGKSIILSEQSGKPGGESEFPCPSSVRSEVISIQGMVALLVAVKNNMSIAGTDPQDRRGSLLHALSVEAPRSEDYLRVAASFLKEKMLNRLAAYHVEAPLEKDGQYETVPLDTFFELDVGGCESKNCTIMISPKYCVVGNEKDACREPGTFDEAVVKEFGDRLFDETVVEEFRARLNERARASSYAITPDIVVQRLGLQGRIESQLAAELGASLTEADAKAVLRGVQNWSNAVEALHRHPVLIGFGDAGSWRSADGPEDASASDVAAPEEDVAAPEEDVAAPEENAMDGTAFGWIALPGYGPESGDGGKQVPRTESVSALVSVPSWWRSLKLGITACWLRDSADVMEALRTREIVKLCVNGTYAPYTQHVQVPGSVSEIYQKLKYEIRNQPHLQPTKYRSQKLEIGRSGQLLLEGGRLWRSTVVTLGQQAAEKIRVLPHMGGVIAEFLCILPPAGVNGVSGSPGPDEQIAAVAQANPVVWTSEGYTREQHDPVDLYPFLPRFENDKPCFQEVRPLADASQVESVSDSSEGEEGTGRPNRQ